MNRRLLFWLFATLITAIAATLLYFQFSDGGLRARLATLGSYGNERDEIDAVVIYSAMLEEQVVEYISGFRTKYPEIPVRYEVFGTNELSERLLAERDDPQADVIWGLSATSLQQLDWYDVTTPYAPAGLYRLPKRFRAEGDPPAWVGQDIWMNAFCINATLLSERNLPIPHSWDDLLDPMYEGTINFPNPSKSGTGFMSMLVYVELHGEQKLWKILDQLDNNVVQYNDSASAGCAAAADGEVAIAVSYGLAAVMQRKNNPDLVIVFPEEGSGWDMEASALIRRSSIKPNAKVLMDYIISDEAMHYYGQHYAITSIPVDYLRPPIGFPNNPADQLLPKDFLWVGANRNRLIRLWEARYDANSSAVQE